ncbi:hypothetical protein [Cupriavidus yeoncheonensis]|uniref:hypothetical protein n=1 Tax=Cupriavidus yeoncheonensis TaxID=1462994 RepID=UPI001BAD60C0|nr:hypothetical protein [Cupriavidus yeoncheonensis]
MADAHARAWANRRRLASHYRRNLRNAAITRDFARSAMSTKRCRLAGAISGAAGTGDSAAAGGQCSARLSIGTPAVKVVKKDVMVSPHGSGPDFVF